MKKDFLELVEQINSIESRFHGISTGYGTTISSIRVIYDVPDFYLWLQRLQKELQEIVDRTGDNFASDTLKEAKKSYTGLHDTKYFSILKGNLIAMSQDIDKYYIEGSVAKVAQTKKPRIFISHSTSDKLYIEKIVSLLDDMGLDQTQLFCSSMPGYDIPVGKTIFDYLREQFLEYNLHVIFVHSPNYYQSTVSLNEMGAAWVLKSEFTSILLPGFNFSEMTGVVNNQTIAIKLDNNPIEVKDKLDQLYDQIADKFELRRKPNIIWQQKRDRFIEDILKIVPATLDTDTTSMNSNIEMLEIGVLVLKSEVAAGKSIYYCPACYQNYKKLYPIVKGSMARDYFCSNCQMRYNIR